MTVCASCDTENPPEARFCMACAAPLAEPEPAREVRKTVTVLFCDVVGSTELGERTDPEALRARMGRLFEDARRAVERHGGTVEKFAGDAVMAVFGIPRVHEDDALRAVRAAIELREAVAAHELEARIGVNTGEVVAGVGETLVTGDVVNVAARLEQTAAPGEVLLGAGTLRLVRDAVSTRPLEPLTLKGKSEPVPAFRLLGLDPQAEAVARRLDTPLVGRRRELRALLEAFERATRERSCHLFTVLGSAGVGKSRLAAEFLDGLDARVVRGRCLHYGEGITFFPVVEALMQLGEPAEPVVASIEEGGTSPQELFWGVRKLLERVAAERPLVAVFDDLHWAEPTFLDLIDHVADLSRGAPILLLCIARPELLDDRAGWGGGKLNATTVLLEPLDADECARLIEGLGDDRLDDATRTRIVEASEGNPLFVEEMLALVREDGDVAVPPTIQALLAARLDRLAAEERTVVERGAVEGKVFHLGAVQELSPERLRAEVATHLVALVRKELIRPDTATLPEEEAFRFRHLLIRDAAYDSLPKETRADLHERFAVWLEDHGTSLVELDEIAGYHLEQAVRYQRELGATEEETAGIAARAAARLGPAGRRAAERGDLPAARNLIARTAELESGTRRHELLLDLAGVMTGQGAFAEATAILRPLRSGDDERIAAHAGVMTMTVRLHDDPDTAMTLAREAVEDAITLFEAIDDQLGLARAWSALFFYHWTLAQAAAAGEAAARLLGHARLAGKVDLVELALMSQGATTSHGPASCSEMERLLSELETAPEAGRSVRAIAENFRGMVARFEGRFADGRVHCLRSQHELRDLGFLALAAADCMDRAEIELAAGDPAEGERILREGIEELERLGEKGWLSTCLGTLARAVVAQGRFDEAEQIARQALETGSEADVATASYAYSAIADAQLGRGEIEAALRTSEQAVSSTARSDLTAHRADALLARARAERAAGRVEEARASLASALDLYEAKGATFYAERAAALLAEL